MSRPEILAPAGNRECLAPLYSAALMLLSGADRL